MKLGEMCVGRTAEINPTRMVLGAAWDMVSAQTNGS